MEKRFSQRKSGKLLAAAVAAMGFAGLTGTQADASLLIDLRASSQTGAIGGVTNGGKNVTTVLGATVTLEVFARLAGANTTQVVGNFDSFGGNNDTRNDDSLQILVGSYRSSAGGLLGNFDPTNGGSTPAQAGAFQGGGGQNGTPADWDSDGDLDIGSEPAKTDVAPMWAARAGNPTFAAKFTGGPFTGGTVPTSFDNNNTVTDGTTSELHVGTLSWVVTGGAGATNINFSPRNVSETGSALWFQDGNATGFFPGQVRGDAQPVSYLLGSPVNVALVPEPAGASLLGLASIGLLARRKKNA